MRAFRCWERSRFFCSLTTCWIWARNRPSASSSGAISAMISRTRRASSSSDACSSVVCSAIAIQLLASVSVTQASISQLKDEISTRLDALRPELEQIGRDIYANPEIAYEERQAVAWLTELLKKYGFAVEIGVANTPTAFVATRRNGSGPTIAFLAEYDGRPGKRHQCARCLRPGVQRDQPVTAADEGRRAPAWVPQRRRHRAQHHPGADQRRIPGARSRRGLHAGAGPEGQEHLPGGRARYRLQRQAELRRRALRRPAQQRGAGETLRGEPAAYGDRPGGGCSLGKCRFHRHGKRESRGAGSASHDWYRVVGSSGPLAGLPGSLGFASGLPGHDRRRQSPGHDRRRPAVRSGPCRAGQGRVPPKLTPR